MRMGIHRPRHRPTLAGDEEVASSRAFLKHLQAALKPGGTLVLSDPNPELHKSPMTAFDVASKNLVKANGICAARLLNAVMLGNGIQHFL